MVRIEAFAENGFLSPPETTESKDVIRENVQEK